MSSSSFAVEISKVRAGVPESLADSVAVEEPLEIRLGYSTPDGRATRSISITMRTPGNDRELAAGFLYTEAIISKAANIASIETCGPPAPDSGNHNVIRCGVCGKTSLDALRVGGAVALDSSEQSFSRQVLIRIPDALREVQHTFDKTGGLHAAAAFNSSGDLITVMEDVGRHNAVDKVVGSLLLNNGLPASTLGLMVSGRASFELMQKTLVAGMPLLAAVSAPSSLAVQLAQEFNMSLIGFLRGDTFNIYAGEERIIE